MFLNGHSGHFFFFGGGGKQLLYVRIEGLSLFLAGSMNLWSSFNQSPSKDINYATLAQRAKANLLLVLVLFLIR